MNYGYTVCVSSARALEWQTDAALTLPESDVASGLHKLDGRCVASGGLVV